MGFLSRGSLSRGRFPCEWNDRRELKHYLAPNFVCFPYRVLNTAFPLNSRKCKCCNLCLFFVYDMNSAINIQSLVTLKRSKQDAMLLKERGLIVSLMPVINQA